MNLDHYFNFIVHETKYDWIYEFNQTSDDFVGLTNQKCEITKWLHDENDDHQALLIVGPTGSGKTSLTQMLCVENQIQFYCRDSRNKRSKKDLQIYFETIKGCRKSILIMDEMEILDHGEYMGISDIQLWLKENHTTKKNIRIIFIVLSLHEKKMKDFSKWCKIIHFDYPTKDEWLCRCSNDFLIDLYQNQPRTILNHLENNIESLCDKEYDMYESYEHMFKSDISLSDKLRVFYNESGTIPIILQENYIDWKLSNFCKIMFSDAMSLADIFHKQMFNNSNSDLQLEMYCCMSTLLPIACTRKQKFVRKKPRFGLMWTKQSAMFQKKKYIQEIEANNPNVPNISIERLYELRKDFEKAIENKDSKTIQKLITDHHLNYAKCIMLFNLFNFSKEDSDQKKYLKQILK